MRASRAFLVVALVVAGVSCGGSRQFVLQGSDRAPGADGQVTIETQEGGNFLVSVSVTNLLPPARLHEGLATYVVWFQPPEQTAQRVGNLNYNEEDRGGMMSATTAVTAFEIVISGETAPDVATPSEYVAFRASVQAPE